jgi:hypothetical protein
MLQQRYTLCEQGTREKCDYDKKTLPYDTQNVRSSLCLEGTHPPAMKFLRLSFMLLLLCVTNENQTNSDKKNEERKKMSQRAHLGSFLVFPDLSGIDLSVYKSHASVEELPANPPQREDDYSSNSEDNFFNSSNEGNIFGVSMRAHTCTHMHALWLSVNFALR